MKLTTNRALAEQQALRTELTRYRDELLMREAFYSAELAQMGSTGDDDEPPALEETA